MDVTEALDMISEGHNVYSQESADACCDALGAPRLAGHVMHSDPPGTWKGLTLAPQSEGKVLVPALDLGEYVARHLEVEPMASFGRGSQGRNNARAIAHKMGVSWPCEEDMPNG